MSQPPHHAERRLPTLAELIDHLFKTRLHPDGREFMYREVARYIPGKADQSTVYRLRVGEYRRPSIEVLVGLCLAFRVDIRYFFPLLDDEDLEMVTRPEID